MREKRKIKQIPLIFPHIIIINLTGLDLMDSELERQPTFSPATVCYTYYGNAPTGDSSTRCAF